MRPGTAKDVAKMTGMSLNKVYELVQRGEIPVCRKVDSRVRFDLEDVERWWKEGEDAVEP
jgi:excisionase family DNA binding protein